MPEYQPTIPEGSTSINSESGPLVLLIPTDLNVRSNGHACILTLAEQLVRAGNHLYLLPYKPFTFFRDFFHRLPETQRNLPFISDLSEITHFTLIVPDSAPPRLVKRLRHSCQQVVWWLLAPAGVLTTFYPEIQKGDLVVAFSEFILPNQQDYLFVHPPAHSALARYANRHRPQKPNSQQVAIYTGKGRLSPLPRDLHKRLLSYKIVLITRSYPATKAALVQLLDNSHGLISCDPLTNLSLEAAILGTPTYLLGNPFSDSAFTSFPANLSDFVTDSSQQFIQLMAKSGPVKKLGTRSLYDKSAKASQLVGEIISGLKDPDASPYVATPEMLASIKNYQNVLMSSGTIQAIRDGQSVASFFIRIYLLTLKTPYRYHLIACYILKIIDDVGVVLYKLGILKAMLMLIVIIHRLISLPRRITRKLRSRIS